MLEYLRSLLLIKAGAADVLDMPDEELEGAREQASGSDIGLLQRALTLWSSANLKADSSSPMPLEMAIIDVALYASQPVPTPEQARPARSASSYPGLMGKWAETLNAPAAAAKNSRNATANPCRAGSAIHRNQLRAGGR